MTYRNHIRRSVWSLACGLLLAGGLLVRSAQAQSQTPTKPLTSQELVRLVYQLPGHPERRDAVVEEIRRRGIDFPLTSGLKGVVATKSGNDELLRRTLEEAERRHLNPTTAAKLPSEAEAQDVLEQARQTQLAVAKGMPDFVVKQLVTRLYAFGQTKSWNVIDHLTIAVSYRETAGEQYKLLATNGLPVASDAGVRGSYEQAGGTSSTGEFVSILTELFADETQAKFRAADTDTIRNRRAIVYEYEVKKENSKQMLKATDKLAGSSETVVGYRGRVWIDRETHRALRLEDISTDIPPDFPITAAINTIDYDQVMISDKQYLLPIHADVELTTSQGKQVYQTRNDIRFRNYQKFGTEVKILEDDDVVDETPKGAPKKP